MSEKARSSHVPTVAGVLPPAGLAAVPGPVGAPMAARSPSPPPVYAGPDSGMMAASLPKACPSCQGRYPADFNVCPRDATPLADAQDDGADPLLGATLGDAYQVVRIIGEGGMGRVYEARHIRLGNKRFAIKMLHPEYARQPDIVARFQREAEAASGIAHPNVLDVYDVHRTADGRPYLVGEYLEGEELGDLLMRVGRLDARIAAHLVRQVCRALAAAHARGVVHRDMKPENVFLAGDQAHPTVKVLDFGISKVGDAAGTALTRTGMIMGTPAYMAPEQARGEKVDHRADVYAVGAILYRALTGRKPFDGDDAGSILTAVLTENPPRPRTIEPSIPDALELVIQRAMAKSPADRYASMAELEADLAPFDPDGTMMSALAPMPAAGTGSGPGQPGNPLDPQGRTMLAGGAGSQPGLSRVTRDAQLARPMVVILSAVGYLWLVFGLVDAIGGLVRILRGAASNLTGTEALLILLGTLFTTVTPAILWARYLGRAIWPNSLRAVELADVMRRVITVAVATYGIGSLLVRLTEATLRQSALDVAWPVWSLLLYVVGLMAGAAAYLSIGVEKRGK